MVKIRLCCCSLFCDIACMNKKTLARLVYMALFYTFFMFLFWQFVMFREKSVEHNVLFALICGVFFTTLMYFYYKFAGKSADKK
jgi:amino acid permease